MRTIKATPEKHCEFCGELLVRKRFKSGTIEDRTVFIKRKFCNETCFHSSLRINITDDYSRVLAREHRKDKCEDCPATENLQVHHIDENPQNNDPANLATLCASCHTKRHWAAGKKPAKPKNIRPCIICGASPPQGLKKDRCPLHYQQFKRQRKRDLRNQQVFV